MDNKRVLLAITLSLAVLMIYQFLFIPPQPLPPEQAPESGERIEKKSTTGGEQEVETVAEKARIPAAEQGTKDIVPEGRDIVVDTSLYRAVLSEAGGGVKSFALKQYKTSLKDSTPMELITTDAIRELPLFFSWGVAPSSAMIPGYKADKPELKTDKDGKSTLVFSSTLSSGIEIERTMEFSDVDYQIQMQVSVRNSSEFPLQGAPYVSLTNLPFTDKETNQWLFSGPAYYRDEELHEIKLDDLETAKISIANGVKWVAYEDPYFMCGIIPHDAGNSSVEIAAANGKKVSTLLSAETAIIQPKGERIYSYTVYFGPKKLSILKTVDETLHRIVDFGWYDIIARPTLYLLNFFYGFLHNYGIAIILVTILIKAAFWPITQKGMKSMKTMQKIQPKLAKIREKYKDDRERLNQEMMRLYQTYKVNPLGGCLPMLLQIPVFFALYKVLLQSIELRHAPFMLWINDLSAPDRLYIGFDLPFLGGIPVLTLLMGASMFLQQKMTPTAADPAQAKVMMFLPVIFTFMFLNFASGLVLYWFVNNLLSIGQQYWVNRQTT